MSSDTPETDAAVVAAGGDWSPVLRETCRRLERERNHAENEMKKWIGFAQGAAIQRDEAWEALSKIEEIFVDGCDTCADREKMGLIARAALEETK